MTEPRAMAEEALAAARRALEQGEYGKVLRMLEPLASDHPPITPLGAGVRLLMATALMGQGEAERAAACCRPLLGCGDPQLRSRARDLLQVLEAPALRRPRSWSLTLPDLGSAPPLEGTGRAAARRAGAGEKEEPPPPPVGPTRAPVGFAALAAALLLVLLLASLLGGCGQVRTDLEFTGPGRLRLAHELTSPSGSPSPWQRGFAEALEAEGIFRRVPAGGGERLRTPVLPAEAALESLAASVRVAGEVGGVTLPPPVLTLRERNWLVGVRQDLLIGLDLRDVPAGAGVDLSLRLGPVRAAAVRRAEPRPIEARAAERRIVWVVEPGARNVLELRCWRWSALGLGAAAIALALPLVLVLQRIRVALGFGLPELPA